MPNHSPPPLPADPPPHPARRAALRSAVTAGYLLPAWLFDRAFAAPRHAASRHAARHPAPRNHPARKLVMLDPGHGGRDPGAIGISGTYEKHISLLTAFELKRQLEATGAYTVLLTRARDHFIPLEDRVAEAERQQVALFVSMHADALTDPDVRGASVYTLARTASDPLTAELVSHENAADRFGPASSRHRVVQAILESLTRQETRILSARMAHDLVGAFRPTLPLLENPARHAEFAVLKSAEIPSILVEMGFMSNRADEAALRQPQHRVRIATAMKQAVDAYFTAANRLTLTAG